MASDCKYNRIETVVSYDGGVSWESQNPPVYHRGTLIDLHSQDCEEITPLERWIVIEGDYLCDGNRKYKKELLEISFDGGAVWYASNPTAFRLGQFVSVDEQYCSYLFEGHYLVPTNEQICAEKTCPTYYLKTVIDGECKCVFNASHSSINLSYRDPIKIVKCGKNIITQELLLNGNYFLFKLLVGECATEIAGNAANHPYLRSIEALDLSNATNLTTIGGSAFYGCSSLTSLTIPDSVTSIGDSAFAFCGSLSSVTIGSGVTTIGNNAFTGCTALSSITVDSHNTTYDSRNNCNSIIETSTNRLIVGSNTSTIPSGVTIIGYGAFTNKNGLRSVVIPDSVTNFERPETSTVTFGDYAFANCTSLTSVTISNNITKLYGSFRDCTSLSNVTIPRSVDHIGLGAFRGCTSLTAITVEATTPPVMGRNETVFDDTNNCPIYVSCQSVNAYKSATGWSKYASRIQGQGSCTKFIATYSDTHTESGDCISSTTISSTDISNKDNVVSIAIGSCATPIANGVFRDCTNLTSVTVDSSNTTYDSRNNCNAIINTNTNTLVAGCKNSTIPNSVTSIGTSAFTNCSSLTSITIPDSVTSIGWGAFEGCTSLTNATIGSGVTTIDYYVFRNCTSLTSCTINNGATTIGYGEFYNCTSLQTVDIPNSVTSIGVTAFVGCTSLSSVTIPDSVTSLGGEAFEGCTSLSNLSIGSGVTRIETSTFRGCTALSSVTIPDSVTSLGGAAFYGCSNLTSVVVGDGVTTIGERTFQDCVGLQNAILGNSVTSIGEQAFRNCTSLTTITFTSTVPPTFGNNVFYSAPIDVIYVPCESIEVYKSTLGYPYNNKVRGISSGDKWIATYQGGSTASAECSCSSSTITSSEIPLYNLISFEVGDCVTDMLEVFSGSSTLSSVTIGNGLTSIGDSTFNRCSGLTSVTLGNSVTTIGERAFQYCSGITILDLPSGVTSIGDYSFYHCSSLTSIDIPSGVTSIGDYSFNACSSLTSVTIPSSVTYIGDFAFYNCSGLTSINIPNGSIEIGAFEGCTSLTSVTLGNSVTSIVGRAFEQCSSLTSITLNATTPPTLSNSSAFSNTNDCPIYVPAQSVDAYKAASVWSDYADRIQPIP